MAEKNEKPSPAHEPLNLLAGMPDHAETTPPWKYIVLAAIFVAWVVLLVLVRVMGQG